MRALTFVLVGNHDTAHLFSSLQFTRKYKSGAAHETAQHCTQSPPGVIEFALIDIVIYQME